MLRQSHCFPLQPGVHFHWQDGKDAKIEEVDEFSLDDLDDEKTEL